MSVQACPQYSTWECYSNIWCIPEEYAGLLWLPSALAITALQLLACQPDTSALLTAYSVQVHLLVRGGKMRASAAMQDRVLNHEKVEVHFSTEVADAYGDKKGLKGLQLRDTSSGWCHDPLPKGILSGSSSLSPHIWVRDFLCVIAEYLCS